MGRIWAISDLHLSGSGDKPMDIFGPAWQDHPQRIAANWDRLVGSRDVVVLSGDLSWAMKPDQALVDMTWLAERPGRKVAIKGNHDYWWPKTRSKLQALLPPGVHCIKKSAWLQDGLGVFGVRGGDFAPLTRYGDQRSQAEVDAVLDRELTELQASIDDLTNLEAVHGPARLKVCLCHYPPIPPGRHHSRFADLIAASGARHCIYGHLHGPDSLQDRVDGEVDGVRYRCTSCDLIGFEPVLVDDLPLADPAASR